MLQNGTSELGVQEGQILVGKYRIDRVLGVGGMGTVVAARHLQLDTDVAVKFLRPSLLTNPEAVARFMQEARAVTRMNNEHVARVFDIGTLPTGVPYMVMEFLDGADMAEVLRQDGRLTVEDAVDFVLQACEAVAQSHALGIVHRDLKPTNLFQVRSPDGRPCIKVLDFGISKVMATSASAADQSVTQASSVMGTPLYMSPEQLEASQTVDERTDIWALGVILYEFLTGAVPFAGNTLSEVSVKVAAREPPPLRELRPEVSPGLAAVIDGCLQKDRDKRYRNVAEMARALLPFGSSRAGHSVERVTGILQPVGRPRVAQAPPGFLEAGQSPWSAETAMISKTRSTGKIVRRKLRTLSLAGTLCLVAVVALFAVAARRGPAPATASREPGQLAPVTVNGGTPATGTTAATGTTGMVVLPIARAPEPPAPPRGRLAVASARGAARAEAAERRAPGRSLKAGRSSRSSLEALATPAAARATASAGPAARSPASRAAPTDDCPVRFELDEQGRKHFNAECLATRPGAAGRATAPPSSLPSSSCNPNFELDEQGRKHFKPDCFANARP